jgi:hypothetical protein
LSAGRREGAEERAFRTSQCIHTPLRTSHSPSLGCPPTTTRFCPHSVQYFTRKLTVVSASAIATFRRLPPANL